MKHDSKLKISVVVPAFNEAANIAQCLEHLAKQTLKPFEVIVVDNCSTDETASIARRYESVRVVREPVQGFIPARNRGFDVARGDIIARVDADSLPAADWVEQIAQTFAHEQAVAITGPLYYHDMPIARVGERIDRAIRHNIKKAMPDFQFLTGANMAIRRNVWLQLRSELCQAPDIHEDMDIALHLAEHHFKVVFNPQMLVGTSARRIDDRPRDFYRYVKRYSNTYRRHGRTSISVRLPMAIFLGTYPLLKLIRFFYRRRVSQIVS